jgi:hypothetical protein
MLLFFTTARILKARASVRCLPAFTQMIMGITTFTPTDAKIGDHVTARLTRVAADGTAPSADPFIPMLQMHVQKDTLGSRQMISK